MAEGAKDDAAIGVLLAKIEALGLTQSTLVVVTSDHGETLSSAHDGYGLEHMPMRFHHAVGNFEETTRIPIVMALPGVLDGGARGPRSRAQRRHRADRPRARGPRGRPADERSFDAPARARQEGARAAGRRHRRPRVARHPLGQLAPGGARPAVAHHGDGPVGAAAPRTAQARVAGRRSPGREQEADGRRRPGRRAGRTEVRGRALRSRRPTRASAATWLTSTRTSWPSSGLGSRRAWPTRRPPTRRRRPPQARLRPCASGSRGRGRSTGSPEPSPWAMESTP